MLSASDLCKQVSTAEGPLGILNNVSLEVAAGASLAIVGASGSGKSTLLGVLAGLDVPSSGRVVFQGQDITALDEEQRAAIRARHVGFVFQSFQLLPGLSAIENVMMPLELHGDADAQGKAEFFLTRVGLQQRLHHYPKQLSGGEQQRVAIARAFASRPDILFADEPTGNLDSATGAHIIDLLFEMNREHKTTLVLVTHEQRLAERCQDRLILDAGEVISGTPRCVA